jgi:putative colanic acid biosynthesis UDP-glucose lipid carrier transferase
MRKNQRFYNVLRYALDAFSILCAYLVIEYAYPFSSEGLTYQGLFIFLSIATWYFCSVYSKLYAERRSNKFSEEIIFVLYNSMLFSVLISALLFFLQPKINLTLLHYLRYVLLIFSLSTITKYIHRKYIHSILSQGKMYDKILLIGAGPSAEYFYETVNKYYYYGYRCVGFLDDKIEKLNGCNYFGKIEQLEKTLKENPIDEVVITLPNDQHDLIKDCVDVCEARRIQVRMLPDAYKYTTTAVQVDNIGIMPVLNISELPLDRLENKIVKRIFDIAFSLLFFFTFGIILLPLIAILIKLTSKGPILFKQERWGLNNEKIICYKFRTMVRESSEVDEDGRYQITTKNDPRVTEIGRLLRRTNLDELPQFWNVLIGNMSVVGPRPHPTPMNLESMHTIENYMLRHIVPPGITGWAQVNGYRGEVRTTTDMQRRVDFDLYYIHRWTFWLDCQIILQTMINFLRGDQNAY